MQKISLPTNWDILSNDETLFVLLFNSLLYKEIKKKLEKNAPSHHSKYKYIYFEYDST